MLLDHHAKILLFGRVFAIIQVLFSWYLFLFAQGAGEPLIPYQDKVLHALVYFLLSSWQLVFFPKKLMVCLLLFIHGVLIELIQPYFMRQRELMDIFSNTAGIMLSFLLYSYITKRYRRNT